MSEGLPVLNCSPQLNELAAALAEAQGEIRPAPKDAANPFFKSRYTSLPAVREAIQEIFKKHGLSVIQMPSTVGDSLQLRTILLHSSGQWIDCGTLQAAVDVSSTQKIGSAITYFRRYALTAISQTVSEEDDDGNSSSAKKLSPEDEELLLENAKLSISTAETLKELNALLPGIQRLPEKLKAELRSFYKTREAELK